MALTSNMLKAYRNLGHRVAAKVDGGLGEIARAPLKPSKNIVYDVQVWTQLRPLLKNKIPTCRQTCSFPDQHCFQSTPTAQRDQRPSILYHVFNNKNSLTLSPPSSRPENPPRKTHRPPWTNGSKVVTWTRCRSPISGKCVSQKSLIPTNTSPRYRPMLGAKREGIKNLRIKP